LIIILTNKRDYTADFAILRMKDMGVDFQRCNFEDFPQRIAISWQANEERFGGYIEFPNHKKVFAEDIRSVWYRRPVLPVPNEAITDPGLREFAMLESSDAINGFFRSLDCFWMSDPEAIRRAEFKLPQLRMAAELGFRIPDTLVTSSAAEAKEFFEVNNGEVIIKPVRAGRLKEDSNFKLIFTTALKKSDLSHLELVKDTPCLFQARIPKLLEVRVTVIGEEIFAVEIHSQDHPQTQVDWRKPEIRNVRHAAHALDLNVKNLCLALTRKMGLAFGAIDLVLTPDLEYIFLEINPNGQWAWLEELTGLPMAAALVERLRLARSN
jgi:glutathione synthase/RimK-type ligase-like ATP-grasp enzyme